jgi:hypothetical protein
MARSDAVRGEESGPILEVTLIGGVGLSASEREARRTGSERRELGRVPIQWPGRIGCPGLLLYFFVLFFFFLFSYLFHNFCKLEPNQFKLG